MAVLASAALYLASEESGYVLGDHRRSSRAQKMARGLAQALDSPAIARAREPAAPASLASGAMESIGQVSYMSYPVLQCMPPLARVA